MTENTKFSASFPTDEELQLINNYTRRPFLKDEVYVFSLTLCDNDVDRDYERFTVESLFELEKLFVGKTGIVDHISSSKNQTARIFRCAVEAVEGRKTLTGDDYFKLTARAYIPITEGNMETILSIDSGIRKEVSVGCAVKDTVCSVCGKPMGSSGCHHIKGQTFGSKLCFAELMNPYDAYEWSFVAVPAQREAGVTKMFNKGRSNMKMEDIMKSIKSKQDVTLSQSDCKKLLSYIEELKKDAENGREYRKELEKNFLRLMAVTEPHVPENCAKKAMAALSASELKLFNSALEKKAEGVLPIKPQLASAKNERSKTSQNKEFKI